MKNFFKALLLALVITWILHVAFWYFIDNRIPKVETITTLESKTATGDSISEYESLNNKCFSFLGNITKEKFLYLMTNPQFDPFGLPKSNITGDLDNASKQKVRTGSGISFEKVLHLENMDYWVKSECVINAYIPTSTGSTSSISIKVDKSLFYNNNIDVNEKYNQSVVKDSEFLNKMKVLFWTWTSYMKATFCNKNCTYSSMWDAKIVKMNFGKIVIDIWLVGNGWSFLGPPNWNQISDSRDFNITVFENWKELYLNSNRDDTKIVITELIYDRYPVVYAQIMNTNTSKVDTDARVYQKNIKFPEHYNSPQKSECIGCSYREKVRRWLIH